MIRTGLAAITATLTSILMLMAALGAAIPAGGLA